MHYDCYKAYSVITQHVSVPSQGSVLE